MSTLYDTLIKTGAGDPGDRHVFACALRMAALDSARPLTEGLGLAPEALLTLIGTYFPTFRPLMEAIPAGASAGHDAIEEPDLRRLLLDHRSRSVIEEEWLAAIIARRSLGANHLWQDLGLFHRRELSALLNRHFHALAVQNTNDMRWKKFFYRQLCERDGILICKAPNCAICTDFGLCFGSEDE
ncbi:MAG: nitrogen fixation protein NifQ [Hyphomicrobium sp.]